MNHEQKLLWKMRDAMTIGVLAHTMVFGVVACGMTAQAKSGGVPTPGRIDAVTVYRGQALVTRIIDVPQNAGLHEIVVTDLPDEIVPSSLYAETDDDSDGVEVRSVRYRITPVEADVREEVRALDEQIADEEDRLDANRRESQLLTQHSTYLDQLGNFVAVTASTELTRGVLNAETLTSLTEFLFEQKESLSERELELSRTKAAIEEKVNLLRRKRSQLTGSSARQVREAVVLVQVNQTRATAIRLRYLVDDATWSPSYNLRSNADHADEVAVEYYASIQQMSGEDWDSVSMTLSTASPSLIAAAPDLEPLAIALTSPRQQQTGRGSSFDSYADARQQLARKQIEAEMIRNVGLADKSTRGKGQRADVEVNRIADQIQILDLSAETSIQQRRREGKITRPQPVQGPSVTYQLTGRTSLPSRSDRQLVQIARIAAGGQFYKLAMPVLTTFVYDEVKAANASRLVLLAGSVSTYVDGQFVGHDRLPMVAIGESFTAGLGIDSSMRAGRELIEKSDRIEGGNRVSEFTYQLTIENFGTKLTSVRVVDRLPYSDDAQISVTLLSSTNAELSDDPTYLNSQRKKGILRWDIDVPGDAVGPDAFVIEYTFSLEYDKQLVITELTSGN